jgi:hypothetical protein
MDVTPGPDGATVQPDRHNDQTGGGPQAFVAQTIVHG